MSFLCRRHFHHQECITKKVNIKSTFKHTHRKRKLFLPYSSNTWLSIILFNPLGFRYFNTIIEVDKSLLTSNFSDMMKYVHPVENNNRYSFVNTTLPNQLTPLSFQISLIGILLKSSSNTTMYWHHLFESSDSVSNIVHNHTVPRTHRHHNVVCFPN